MESLRERRRLRMERAEMAQASFAQDPPFVGERRLAVFYVWKYAGSVATRIDVQ